ncbi:hypothetical protein [Rhizobium sp. BK008]|uniref:hypothetical protein n=1 Tax=Rhizobium sp. BK008 TaxID=2587094 RepID=UPI0016145C58|nr:hypothetical protein [Rhizobium sp. BK008]MBB4250864.1 hypothetical protein [Rhizobium sp. BK008]
MNPSIAPASRGAAKNIPLNEIGILLNSNEVFQPTFITTRPADQKAGDHDRQTDEVHHGTR